MAARLSVEERLASVEARMSVLDELPAQINRLRDELLVRIDDARRETRLLHEDVLGRIAVIGEGFTAQGDVISRMVTTLDDSRTLLDTVLTRLMAIESHLPAKRRKKTPLEPE